MASPAGEEKRKKEKKKGSGGILCAETTSSPSSSFASLKTKSEQGRLLKQVGKRRLTLKSLDIKGFTDTKHFQLTTYVAPKIVDVYHAKFPYVLLISSCTTLYNELQFTDNFYIKSLYAWLAARWKKRR